MSIFKFHFSTCNTAVYLESSPTNSLPTHALSPVNATESKPMSTHTNTHLTKESSEI